MVNTNSEGEKGSGRDLTPEEIGEMKALYAEFVQDMMELNDEPSHSMDSMREWMLKALEFNVQTGTNLRSRLVPIAYKNFVQNPTKANMRLAFLLGWINEVFNKASFIADDLVDEAPKRGDRPSWHNQKDTGYIAVNDTLMLFMGCLRLLKKYFGDLPCYPALHKTVRDCLDKWTTGRILLDQCSRRNESGRGLQEKLEISRYSNMIKYKSTYITLLLPIKVAMIFAGKDSDPQLMKQVEELAFSIGHYLQVREDFENVFGSSKEQVYLMEEIRTDFASKTWSFLMVQAAKQQCTSEKLEEMRKSPKLCRKTCEQLGLREIYEKYQLEQYEKIMGLVKLLRGDNERGFFSLLTQENE